jgi:hypothetical protein
VKKISLNPLRWLNSVPLGITLMALTAGYIAIGSGIASVREYFEMTELQFFDAWPLKLLMVLLIATLVVVTWKRIPLTPPRYGVWCVHIGIITLILGTCFYYNHKLEGRVRLFTNPANGAVSTDHFYDKDERSLYVKVNDTPWSWYPLPKLPRFKDYDQSLGNSAELVSRGLHDILPTAALRDDPSARAVNKTLSQWMGWKDPVTFDIVGYYTYAQTTTRFVDDPTSSTTGVRLSVPDVHEEQDVEAWVVQSDPRYRYISQFGAEFEHRQADATAMAAFTDAAKKIFQLDFKLPGYADTIYVQPGQTYPLGKTGYSIAVENFDPAWPMFSTHEIVQALTLKVTSPTQTFRRMLLNGKDVQTDFKLDVAGAPPIGKRQPKPLDDNLAITFHFADPYQLLPQQAGGVKHTLITTGDAKAMTDIVAGLSSAVDIRQFDDGTGDVQISPADSASAAPFAPAAMAADAEPPHPAVRVHLEGQNHIRRQDTVESVPTAQRDRTADEDGQFQVAKVKVTFGDWSQIVVAPFTDEAGDAPWDGGLVQLPGVNTVLQLQLGNTRRQLPAKITLTRFQLIPYPGGDENNPRSLMKDFRSTLTVDDLASGEQTIDVAHMNHPVYFRNGDWLFFQAAYDGENHNWTQLGIGNRPGVLIMITGCVMIFVGLAYAFYAKPLIIARMKRNAIARAVAAGKQIRTPAEAVTVS